MGVTGTTFGELRRVNVARCEEVFHKLDRWNALEWAGAMCGEAGEAANLAKKLRRLDEADADKDSLGMRVGIIHELMVEIADTVIYADLLHAYLCLQLEKLGVPAPTLSDTIRNKFNRVSLNRKSEHLL